MSHNNKCNDFYTMCIRTGFIQEFADKAVPEQEYSGILTYWAALREIER